MNRIHHRFSIRRSLAVLGLLATSLASITLAGPATPPPSSIRRGVEVKDACGRQYRPAANARRDVLETEPNFATRNHCTWKVGADKLCRCVREIGQPPGDLQGMKLKKRAPARPAPTRGGSR